MESLPDNISQSKLPRNLTKEISNIGMYLNDNKNPSKTVIQRFEDRLNRHSEAIELSRYSSVIGPSFSQESERLVEDQNTIIYFSNIAIKSLSLNRSTYSDAYRTYVEIEDTQTKCDPKTHFIPYNDIILIPDRDEETIEIETIRDLHHQTTQCYNALGDYPYLTEAEQETMLDRLAEEAGDVFMRNYSQEFVVIVAPIFYKVPKPGKMTTLTNVISMDQAAQHANSPVGSVLRCAFIEQIITPQSTGGQLEINEPCIVLSDEYGNPSYFVPISQVKEIVRVDSETIDL